MATAACTAAESSELAARGAAAREDQLRAAFAAERLEWRAELSELQTKREKLRKQAEKESKESNISLSSNQSHHNAQVA